MAPIFQAVKLQRPLVIYFMAFPDIYLPYLFAKLLLKAETVLKPLPDTLTQHQK